MRTIETKVFLFNELSEDIQQKVINRMSDINLYDGCIDHILYDAKEIGLKIDSFDLYRRQIDGEFMFSACEVAQNILNNHGENCDTYKTAEKFMEEFRPVFAEYMQTEENELDLIDIEDNFLNELLEDYLSMLQREEDYLISDEAIIEAIEANGYEFTAEGRLI